MGLSTASRGLLEAFPGVAPGDVEIRVLAGDAGAPGAEILPDGRARITRTLPDAGVAVEVTYDRQAEATLRPAIDLLIWVVTEREQIEQDMESMYSGSLALLEETSMVGDTMPLLSTGGTEHEIAAMGLTALVVAASVERAIYVRCAPQTGACEVLVQAVMDPSGRKAEIRPYQGEAVLVDDLGLVGEVLEQGRPLVLGVPEGGRLGAPGSPESLAGRQVIAVPVRNGTGSRSLLLGALLVMDKRPRSYSNQDELGSSESKLTMAVAAMLGSVLGARKVAELQKEMDLATAIQRQILPDRPVEVAGFDVAGASRTSGDVGGDYFDYVPMADGRRLVIVADVSGHNLASGMVMVGARATLRALAASRRSPKGIFDALAARLLPDLTRTEQFITAVAAVLGDDSATVELVNAGHHDSLWLHAATGEVEALPACNTILGFLPDARYRSRRVTLAPGDVLLLYTDGIVEATAADGEMFGERRVLAELVRRRDRRAQEILDGLLGAVSDFVNSGRPEDDMTAVVIKARGEGERP